MNTWLLCSVKKPSHLSLIFPCLALRLLSLCFPPQLLIPLGACRKKRAATPAAAEQVYHCLGALSWLVDPLTWNVPMRQSGATGAWRHAAGRDNLLSDAEQRVEKDFPARGRHLSKKKT